MIRLIPSGSPAPHGGAAASVATAALHSAALAVNGRRAATEPGIWAEVRARGARARGLLEHCRREILGQDEALRTICLAIWATEVKFSLPSKRPRGVFLCLGPTGVGKTETSKQVTRHLSDGEPILFAVNQFKDAGSGKRFQQMLVEAIRSHPHGCRVLVFDEVDKAAQDAMDVLLSILDEGRLLLPDGSFLWITDFYVFLCSNCGSDRLYTMDARDETDIGLMRDFVFEEAARTMRPELFARCTRQIFYRPLSDQIQREIVRLRLTEKLAVVSAQLMDTPIAVADSALAAIVGLGFHDQRQGARRIRNLVEEMVEAAAARGAEELPLPPLELRARPHGGFGDGGELEITTSASGHGRGGINGLPGAAFPLVPNPLPR